MGKKFAMLLLLVSVVFAGSSCSSNVSNKQASEKGAGLTVSAASSLQKVLAELEQKYKASDKNTKIRFNFGGSGSLKSQISNGAPVDLFLSASSDEIEHLIDEGQIRRKDTEAFIGNSLVLIMPQGRSVYPDSFKSLIKPEIKKISIGVPETVPAGTYAKETLQSAGIWNEVEGKMVFAKDVRQVLTYVETGNVDAGIVYRTDALSSENISLVTEAENGMHSEIVYQFGIINRSKNKEAARDFLSFLTSKEAARVFEKNGYTIRGKK
ncbi:molybdate transport system substrate-binding protein [Peribacillus deserti]|uniref:Molybdate transport system substrate-binding protein n=1 Tax=Peribacillus deserti TaxID=673318 RepID=A0ABS2QLT0_9BACI|nr:molybdate ABC transporter substrate-binding protein [Peribacillus deserti]MBM7694132.1 molybdate transport system substrate-binding protein [Peribacillus deserti]